MSVTARKILDKLNKEKNKSFIEFALPLSGVTSWSNQGTTSKSDYLHIDFVCPIHCGTCLVYTSFYCKAVNTYYFTITKKYCVQVNYSSLILHIYFKI